MEAEPKGSRLVTASLAVSLAWAAALALTFLYVVIVPQDGYSGVGYMFVACVLGIPAFLAALILAIVAIR